MFLNIKLLALHTRAFALLWTGAWVWRDSAVTLEISVIKKGKEEPQEGRGPRP